ncbi:MAG: hypothetical protein M1169_04980, partial [Firmicutes bacterium]|nr:hypothetical protein [Bacillota bacterium]
MGGLTGGIGGSQGFSPLSFLGGFGLGGLMGGMMGGGMGMMGGFGGGMLPMMMMGGLSMLPLMMMMGGMFNQGQQAGLGGGYGGGYGGGFNPIANPGYGGDPNEYAPGGFGLIGANPGYAGPGGIFSPNGPPGAGYQGGYDGAPTLMPYGPPSGLFPIPSSGGYPPIAQCPNIPPQHCCCCDPECGGGNQFPPQGSGELNNNTQNKTVSYTDSHGYKTTINYSNPQYPIVTGYSPDGKMLFQESGDPHEQLGQGVQDLNNGVEGNWTQNNRQIIYPDGTVVSLNANGASGAGAGINGMNIVDGSGQQAVQVTGVNSGNPDVQETNNPYLIAQDANSINYTNAAALGQEPNGQYAFEQLQSRSLPVGPAPGGAQPQQNNPGAPLWSWLLCPPAALGYDVAEHAGIGAGID